MEKISSYSELYVWKESIKLVSDIYRLTKNFPEHEKFGLVSQLNRAAVSVPANISEGWGRGSTGSYVQFLKIARGSLSELETLIHISNDLSIIQETTKKEIVSRTTYIHKMLSTMIKQIMIKGASRQKNKPTGDTMANRQSPNV